MGSEVKLKLLKLVAADDQSVVARTSVSPSPPTRPTPPTHAMQARLLSLASTNKSRMIK